MIFAGSDFRFEPVFFINPVSIDRMWSGIDFVPFQISLNYWYQYATMEMDMRWVVDPATFPGAFIAEGEIIYY